MAKLVQKKGDTRKAAWRTNIALLNSTVELKVRKDDAPISTTGNVVVDDPYGGIVTWDHGGELEVGEYQVELWITRDGELFKAPSEGFETLVITQDLG